MFLADQVRPLAFLVCVALLAAPVIGFSHAAIPHGHTHTNDNALHTVIEHGLDGSLSRKDIVLPAFLLVLFVLVQIVFRVPAAQKASTHDEPLLQALRRGVLPHRKFG